MTTGRPRLLTSEQARTIRVEYRAGTPQAELARHYGVSPQLVSHIIRGRRYPEAGGPIRQTDPETGDTQWTCQ